MAQGIIILLQLGRPGTEGFKDLLRAAQPVSGERQFKSAQPPEP